MRAGLVMRTGTPSKVVLHDAVAQRRTGEPHDPDRQARAARGMRALCGMAIQTSCGSCVPSSCTLRAVSRHTMARGTRAQTAARV